MNSTSHSKVIAKVNNLTLSYKLNQHSSDSLKESFIKVMSSPFSTIFNKYDQHLVLDNISFNINEGDRIGLLGVNGVGKTSLCRIISGMFNPTKGEININGEVRAIFDTSIGILEDLTGRENATILMELMFPTLDKETKKKFINEALEFSELNDFLDIPFKKYSKGMQARLCLSLISCTGSDLLILDEVFDGADTFFKEKIAKRVLKMINNSGAVIFVSHSADQIKQTCNRLIVIDNKKICYDGEVDKGIEHYLELYRE